MNISHFIIILLIWRETAALLLGVAAVRLCRKEDKQKAAGPRGTCGRNSKNRKNEEDRGSSPKG